MKFCPNCNKVQKTKLLRNAFFSFMIACEVCLAILGKSQDDLPEKNYNSNIFTVTTTVNGTASGVSTSTTTT